MGSNWWEYKTLEEAMDRALWLNFRYHLKDEAYFVVDGPEFYSVVNQEMLTELGADNSYPLPESLASLGWETLDAFKQREELPSNWETMIGSLRGIGTEVLHFMVHYKVPLALLFCHEIASRGFDTKGKWVGFDKAEAIWKNEYQNYDNHKN